MPYRSIHFVASKTEEAQAALAALRTAHGEVALEDADVIVALGGDGFMLQTLHRHGARGLPVYGMKLGTVGFHEPVRCRRPGRAPGSRPAHRAASAA